VGKALVSSDEIKNMEKGEIVKNLHYISDKFWEVGKTLYD
jgi:PUA domain protein